ncbi:efflux RND transporter periplasmic adaptor subunit [Sphingomonas bacterium]|uniref:efflux RND transporter periplasmic adaptor subunit n=1 Tax=Sphingomonas bacterium TaxID=1895847 RepID=UPI0015762DB9|nr:efflux RND transporter periplasmic adaptor subunit [Sphingomonas bacterium]
MIDFDHEPPLPTARRLGTAGQGRWLLIAAAVVVAVFVVTMVWRRIATPVDTPAPPLPAGTFRATPEQLAQMKIAVVGNGVADSHVDATGTISVDEDHSTPVLLPYSGQVTEVFVQAGQHVVRGQPLLKIASPDFVEARGTLASTAAARATAAAQLKIASDNAARQQAIYQTAGGALKDYRQAQSDVVTAGATLRSADAALTAARDKLALFGKDPAEVARLQTAGDGNGTSTQTTYRSPVAGVVASRGVAPGQYVGAGGDKPVMTIADFGHVWLIAQLPEGDAASVHVGDAVEVTTPAYPGRTFHAVVDNVAAALDPATHRLPVRATVVNPGEALKPQMFASFQIARAGPGAALLVPAAAVIHEGDSARVWVLGPDRLLRARTVVVSGDSDGMAVIAGGLKRGDRIVTAGALFVNEAGAGQ